jgi:hypothetical protein
MGAREEEEWVEYIAIRSTATIVERSLIASGLRCN